MLPYDGIRHGFLLLPVHEHGQHGDLHGQRTPRRPAPGSRSTSSTRPPRTAGPSCSSTVRPSPRWGITGNYVRTANLQRLQLWNEGLNNNDFDDVSVATAPPPGATSSWGADGRIGRTARSRGLRQLDGSAVRRWQRHHRLPHHAVRRRHRTGGRAHGLGGHELHGCRPDQRHRIHLHGCRGERGRHRRRTPLRPAP